MRPHTVRRPRLALGDGAATRVSFFGPTHPCLEVEAHSLQVSAFAQATYAFAQAVTSVGCNQQGGRMVNPYALLVG